MLGKNKIKDEHSCSIYLSNIYMKFAKPELDTRRLKKMKRGNADTLHQSSLTDVCYMLSAARCNAALVSGSQHVCSITSSVSHYSVLVYADSNTRLIDLLLPLY